MAGIPLNDERFTFTAGELGMDGGAHLRIAYTAAGSPGVRPRSFAEPRFVFPMRTATMGDIGVEDIVFEAGGLGRRVRLFRLPEENERCELNAEFELPCWLDRDTPIYAVVTLEDGHRAWTSPIYIVR